MDVVRHVLLLGPTDDLAVSALAADLQVRGVPHTVCSTVTDIRFSVRHEGVRRLVRVYPPQCDPVDGSGLALFIRSPGRIVLRGEDKDARFSASEYFAALWSLAGLAPVAINRPTRWAWDYDRALLPLVPSNYRPPELWTCDVATIERSWPSRPNEEVHIEDMISGARGIVSSQELRSWLSLRSGPHALRAILASGHDYVVHIFVGTWNTVVINEPEYDVYCATHRRFIKRISTPVLRQGTRFFALVLLLSRGRPWVVKIAGEPPYSWYREQASIVHAKLLEELAG